MANIYHAGNRIGDAIPGHAIKNGSDVTMTQRNNLQFVGATVTDDNVNDKTVVTIDASGDIGSKVTVTTSEVALDGATVTLTDGTTTLTGQIVSGEAVFANITFTGTYTITVTNGVDTLVKQLSAPYFGNYTINFEIFNAYINITTTSANLYNQTITAYKDGVAVGTTAFNGAGSATYTASETGTYTFSATISTGTFTSDPVVVTEETTYTTTISAIPDGSTVTPTDDIQIWLNCAGIFDKSYTTVSEVLADSTALLALMSDSNAADYLVRSTTWASDITADSTAMTDIGANDYTADTLLSNSTWLTAICNSTYFENVLNVKVPAMTSENTPSGQVGYTDAGDTSNQIPWKTFSGDSSARGWMPKNYGDILWYHFTESVCIKKATISLKDVSQRNILNNYQVVASNDGSTFTNIGEQFVNSGTNVTDTQVLSNNADYPYWGIKVVSAASSYSADKGYGYIMQFYGR